MTRWGCQKNFMQENFGLIFCSLGLLSFPNQSRSHTAIFLSELRVLLPLIVLTLKTPAGNSQSKTFCCRKSGDLALAMLNR